MVNISISIDKNEVTAHLKALYAKKYPWHMVLEIQVLACDRYTNLAGKRLDWVVSEGSSSPW